MTSEICHELTAAGLSLWLDDLDRGRIPDGLNALIAGSGISGVTTNPTIFDRALRSGANAYHAQLDELAKQDVTIDEAIRVITTDDVRAACDVFQATWESSGGVDGRVSIEVDPRLAHDVDATVHQAIDLWNLVDRPNAMIKIPATVEGLAAIPQVIGRGISVNVTLIFSIERYQGVMDAYADGLRRAQDAGVDLTSIESVASFFVSRVDTSVDALLDSNPTPASTHLRGKAAIANARLAWLAHQEYLRTPIWTELARAGARPQRPLWASTGVKDKRYDATRYVLGLVAPGCVNTLPESTLIAVREYSQFRGITIMSDAPECHQVLDDLAASGIDLGTVCEQLETDGVKAFVDSWHALRATVAERLGKSEEL